MPSRHAFAVSSRRRPIEIEASAALADTTQKRGEVQRAGDDQVSKAAKAYGATYEKIHHPGEDPDVYFMNHSAFTYLISPNGKWELLYDFDKLRDTEKIVADIEQVLAGD